MEKKLTEGKVSEIEKKVFIQQQVKNEWNLFVFCIIKSIIVISIVISYVYMKKDSLNIWYIFIMIFSFSFVVGSYISPYLWILNISNILHPSNEFYLKRKSLYYLREYEKALNNHNYFEAQNLHDKMQDVHTELCKLLEQELKNMKKSGWLNQDFLHLEILNLSCEFSDVLSFDLFCCFCCNSCLFFSLIDDI